MMDDSRFDTNSVEGYTAWQGSCIECINYTRLKQDIIHNLPTPTPRAQVIKLVMPRNSSLDSLLEKDIHTNHLASQICQPSYRRAPCAPASRAVALDTALAPFNT